MIQWFIKFHREIAFGVSVASLLLSMASAFVAYKNIKLMKRRSESLKALRIQQENHRDQLSNWRKELEPAPTQTADGKDGE